VKAVKQLTMPKKNDPETLKIPAYIRNKAIVKRDRQKLLLTAWDRKEAGVKPGSKKSVGVIRRNPPRMIEDNSPAEILKSPNRIGKTATRPSAVTQTKTRKPAASKENTPVISDGAKIPYAGEVTHYLNKINVAIIKTTLPLKQEDLILIEGNECIFTQVINGMQIDRKDIKRAKKNSHIGMKVNCPAKVGGKIFKIG